MLLKLLAPFRCQLGALAVLAAAVAALRWASYRPPVVEATNLAADPGAWLGSEAIVTGEWVRTGPSQWGHILVVLQGRDGRSVVCHFEDVPTSERAGLETRLLQYENVAIYGCCNGVEDCMAVVRRCRLLDWAGHRQSVLKSDRTGRWVADTARQHPLIVAGSRLFGAETRRHHGRKGLRKSSRRRIESAAARIIRTWRGRSRPFLDVENLANLATG
jgi:hypothetical protein